jgi:septum formation inhibitor-activating ATPase MinD
MMMMMMMMIIIIITSGNSHIGHCTHTAESANVEIQWS